jgi:outer membrane protein assembly factor BamE (lipoprotein component of BamABCDE complex)
MVVFLTLCLAALEACLPCSGTMSGGTRDVGTLANLVKERALLCLVHKGMTDDQVERILGRPDSGILRFGAGWEIWYYRSLGVDVEFNSECKVIRVSYSAYQ